MTTSNFPKGGDFMEREIPQAVNPDQAIRTGDINNSRFPERVGRIKPDALEIAETVNEQGQVVIDHALLKSVSSMDGRE